MFSLAASSVYIFNDLIDKDKDTMHPKKKIRPIASGKITLFEAKLSFQSFLLSLAYWVSKRIDLLSILAVYVLLNLAYSSF